MTLCVRWVLVASAIVCALQAAAETVAPAYPDFTFKRISAPKSGSQKRIMVQIDPVEQAERLASALPAPEHPIPRGGVDPALGPVPSTPAAPLGSYSWFWDQVSPNLADKAGRFSLALDPVRHA